MKRVLKLCKSPSYYAKACLANFILLLLKIICFSELNTVVSQFMTTYQGAFDYYVRTWGRRVRTGTRGCHINARVRI